jgi:hypothetical protein
MWAEFPTSISDAHVNGHLSGPLRQPRTQNSMGCWGAVDVPGLWCTKRLGLGSLNADTCTVVPPGARMVRVSMRPPALGRTSSTVTYRQVWLHCQLGDGGCVHMSSGQSAGPSASVCLPQHFPDAAAGIRGMHSGLGEHVIPGPTFAPTLRKSLPTVSPEMPAPSTSAVSLHVHGAMPRDVSCNCGGMRSGGVGTTGEAGHSCGDSRPILTCQRRDMTCVHTVLTQASEAWAACAS